MLYRLLLAASFLLLSISGFAQPETHDIQTHGLFLGFGNENVSNKNAQRSLSGTVVNYQYQYIFNKNSSIKIGYIKGNSDDFGCYFFCIPDDPDDRSRFNSKQIKYQHTFPVSNRHAFYANIGIDFFEDINYTGDGAFTDINKGTGHSLGVGWQFRAYNGFGVGYEYANLWLDDTKVASTSIHFSWLF